MSLKKANADTFFAGPPLEEGPMPALFYFALSAKDSLTKDPYNQPIQFLNGEPIRIFSLTLPCHENEFPPEKAMGVWKEKMESGVNLIPPFIEKVEKNFSMLKAHITTCATAGLSRGGFIACHVAAKIPEINHVLGYAPLTRLDYAPELNLETLTPKLYRKKVRFYMGNHDTRVGTEHGFSFIHRLATAASSHRVRNAPIEMIIGPSIGHQGHGTAPHVFQSGVNWLKQELLS